MLSSSISTLIVLVISPLTAQALPQQLIGRQVSTTPSDPNSNNTQTDPVQESNGNNSSEIPIAIIIPVIVILVLIALIILFSFRTKIKTKLKSIFSKNTLQPISTRDSYPRTITAEQLSGHNSRVDIGTTTTNPTSNPSNTTTTTTTTASGTAVDRRNRRARERDRNIRRTESGRSVKTLPVYSKDAGDEELVLVRQRSQSSFSSGSYSSDDERDITQNAEGDAERGLLPTHRRSNSSRSSRTIGDEQSGRPIDSSLSSVGENREQEDLEEIELETRTPSPTSGIPSPQPDLIPSSPTPDTAHHRSESLVRREYEARSWGLAPTYLEAMSSPTSYPSPGETSAQVPPPMNLRTRTSSTFKGLLSKAGFSQQSSYGNGGIRPMRENRNSSTSLLLQPTTSRASSSFVSRTRSRSPSASTSNSPWESTTSLLMISSPLPNTAIRASFDESTLPKAGLSDDQMKFLSSKEAIIFTGVKMDNVPEYKKRRRPSRSDGTDGESNSMVHDRRGSSTSTIPLPDNMRESSNQEAEEEGELPSWEASEIVRRQNEAFQRRNLSKPPSHVSEISNEDETADQDNTSISISGSSKEARYNDVSIQEGSPGMNLTRENTIKRLKPIPPPIQVNLHPQNPTDDSDTSSPNTFRTAPYTPILPTNTNTPTTATPRTTTNMTDSTNLTITPRFEIEPPTPTITTPPPTLPV